MNLNLPAQSPGSGSNHAEETIRTVLNVCGRKSGGGDRGLQTRSRNRQKGAEKIQSDVFASTPHEEQEQTKKESGPWRVAGWKLQAAFRKEAGPRCGGQAEVSSFISKVFLTRLGQQGTGTKAASAPGVRRMEGNSASKFGRLVEGGRWMGWQR